ncbi:MAG TPA: hemolysin family protein [Anaerolineales bacterium]|nr:hemolysin family protein [Anaerolineales bacterium]
MLFSGLAFALLVLVALNFYVTAAKIGFLNARLARILAYEPPSQVSIEPTIKLLKQRIKVGTGLQIIHVTLRFWIAGLVLVLGAVRPVSNLQWAYLGVLLLISASLLSLIEQYIETRVLLNPEKTAFSLTPFTRALLAPFAPVLFIPVAISRALAPEAQSFYRVTEDELRKLLEAGQEEGVLEKDERKMITSIFQFREKLAREIMVPRIDILALNVTTPVQSAADIMLKSGFSRVPVFQESIDNIVGILYIKDILRFSRENKLEGPLHDKLRPAYFVPETKKADELLTEMQNRRMHIALIVDEYGGVAGMVTLEDLMEEIVGEIQDEYDQAEEKIYHQVNESEFIFQARIDLDEFNEIMESDLPTDEADTLGGLIYNKIGRVPKSGEEIQTENILLTVEQVSGRRIRKVKAKRTIPQSNPQTLNSHVN